MKLPHLDRLVPLERGEAWLLARTLDVFIGDIVSRRITPVELLTTLPLIPLLNKLGKRQLQELRTPVRPGKRPKPHLFRMSYDQLAALRFNHLALFQNGFSEAENLQLQVIMGKCQQQSLTYPLGSWIKFT